MNSKGQVLVIFVIILPIFLFLFVLAVDYGILSTEKRKIDNNIRYALEYYLNNIDNDKVYDNTIELLESNLKDIEISINDKNEYVDMEVKSNYKSLYSNIFKTDLLIRYKGLKENKKIIKG